LVKDADWNSSYAIFPKTEPVKLRHRCALGSVLGQAILKPIYREETPLTESVETLNGAIPRIAAQYECYVQMTYPSEAFNEQEELLNPDAIR